MKYEAVIEIDGYQATLDAKGVWRSPHPALTEMLNAAHALFGGRGEGAGYMPDPVQANARTIARELNGRFLRSSPPPRERRTNPPKIY